jgi:4-hydroxybenzoate polyprenyltransferase
VTISSLIYYDIDLKQSTTTILIALIYFSLYVYTFTITNQLNTIEEDKINKPFRPLPSGITSKKEMIVRELLFTFIFLLFGFYFGIIKWALLWVVVSTFHNFIGHKYWISKNIISMSLGIFSIIGAGWELTQPIKGYPLQWGIIISLVFGLCAVIQDFRDVKGDKLINRKTLPIDLGDFRARLISILFSLLSYILLLIFVFIPSNKTLLAYIFGLIITFLFLIIIGRLLFFKTEKDDHYTYTILLYLFNVVLFTGFIYL